MTKSTLAADLALPLSFDVAPSSTAVEREVLRLFDESERPLLRYVSSFGLEPDECEDVVQDTFVALFHHLRLGRSRTNLRAWLFRVAHHTALKRRRRLLRLARWMQPDDVAATRAWDPGRSPEQVLLDAARVAEWRRILHALPNRDRRCLALRAEGLRYRDIATVLGVSLGAVAKSMSRAASRLLPREGVGR